MSQPDMILAERIVRMLRPGREGGWGAANLSVIAYQMSMSIDRVWPTVQALEAAGRLKRCHGAGYEEWTLP